MEKSFLTLASSGPKNPSAFCARKDVLELAKTSRAGHSLARTWLEEELGSPCDHTNDDEENDEDEDEEAEDERIMSGGQQVSKEARAVALAVQKKAAMDKFIKGKTRVTDSRSLPKHVTLTALQRRCRVEGLQVSVPSTLSRVQHLDLLALRLRNPSEAAKGRARPSDRAGRAGRFYLDKTTGQKKENLDKSVWHDGELKAEAKKKGWSQSASREQYLLWFDNPELAKKKGPHAVSSSSKSPSARTRARPNAATAAIANDVRLPTADTVIAPMLQTPQPEKPKRGRPTGRSVLEPLTTMPLVNQYFNRRSSNMSDAMRKAACASDELESAPMVNHNGARSSPPR